MERTRVLVVDDETTVQYVLTTLLQKEGYETESAGSAEEALTKLERGPISVAFLDIVLPGLNGLNLLDRIIRLVRGIIVTSRYIEGGATIACTGSGPKSARR